MHFFFLLFIPQLSLFVSLFVFPVYPLTAVNNYLKEVDLVLAQDSFKLELRRRDDAGIETFLNNAVRILFEVT